MWESCPNVMGGGGGEGSKNREQYEWSHQNWKEPLPILGTESSFQGVRLQTSSKQWWEKRLEKRQKPGHALSYPLLWNLGNGELPL